VPREIKAPEPKTESSTSFDGKHTIEFNEASHRYKLNGKPCVGVTTFLKGGYPTSQGLISWQKGQALEYLWDKILISSGPGFAFGPTKDWYTHDEKAEWFKAAKLADRAKSQEAADIGSLIHEFCFLYETVGTPETAAFLEKIKALPKDPQTKVLNGIERFIDWRRTVSDELVAAESLVASPTYMYCGKFDKLAMRDGKLILSDYKSSKAIYMEMYVQLAAYATAIKEWMGLDVGGLEILRFGKEDGEFETLLIDDPIEIQRFKDQAIRCRETFEFTKWEKDERWSYSARK
jgi:hypothetical protein